jgi:ribosomal protein S18 acetylase RimI-like enzyme
MEITQAKGNDLIEVLFLLKVCILDMNMKGLKHWNSVYPSTEHIRQDLENGRIYLVRDRKVCKGMVTLNETESEDYMQLEFPSGRNKPLYLKNLAVHPRWQGKGIAKLLIDYASKFAREKGFNCIRLDVYNSCENSKKLCEKQSFKEVALFHRPYQKIPYVCYEKLI